MKKKEYKYITLSDKSHPFFTPEAPRDGRRLRPHCH